MTTTHNALDLNVHEITPDPTPPGMGPHCTGTPAPPHGTSQPRPLLVTSGGQDCRHVQTCSRRDPHNKCRHHLVATVRMLSIYYLFTNNIHIFLLLY